MLGDEADLQERVLRRLAAVNSRRTASLAPDTEAILRAEIASTGGLLGDLGRLILVQTAGLGYLGAVIPFAALPPVLLDPSNWARVDDPNRTDALFRSASGSVLAQPPEDGTPWRPETIPEIDVAAEDEIAEGALVAFPEDVLALTNADLWHRDGVLGKGVKIAIFDLGWFADVDRDKVAPFTTHDCLETPTCESPFDPLRPVVALGGGSHGWACAETVRSVAPEAELFLVRVESQTMYENAVAWAIREGIDIISMSMTFYNDSIYDGQGPHDALTTSLEEAGALMVTSSGNDALLHWMGPWVDADGDDRLDGDGSNGLQLYLTKTTGINLVFNQWGIRCGDTDLEIRVYDPRGYEVGRSDDEQLRGEDQDCEPVDVVTAQVLSDDWYRVEVHRLRGSAVGLQLDLISKSGQWLDYMPQGSVADPQSHPYAVAVGAVRTDLYWTGPPESYSSYGPTRIGLKKPEIAGPDGLSVTTYGPVGFFGTSASTPAVAGLIALVLADERTRDSSFTARQAFERLTGYAHRPTPTPDAPDDAYGAGMARLPVREPLRGRCGERPLWMTLLLPFLWWPSRRYSCSNVS